MQNAAFVAALQRHIRQSVDCVTVIFIIIVGVTTRKREKLNANKSFYTDFVEKLALVTNSVPV